MFIKSHICAIVDAAGLGVMVDKSPAIITHSCLEPVSLCGEVKSVFIPHPVFDGRSMPVFTSWISWGPCRVLGKLKMPHHNVTFQPQWQTTNPRDAQLNDLSHLVLGVNIVYQTTRWWAGYLLNFTPGIPRPTNVAKHYEQGQTWLLPWNFSTTAMRWGRAWGGGKPNFICLINISAVVVRTVVGTHLHNFK